MAEQNKDTSKSPLKRAYTMNQTIEEAKNFLKDEPFHLSQIEEAKNKNGNSQENGDDEEQEVPNTKSPTKKAALQRTQTMAETVEEAKGLIGDEKLGKTRSQDTNEEAPTEELREKKSPLKRTTTIMETVEESAGLLGDKPLGRTRASDAIDGAGEEMTQKSPLKRIGTMDQTVKDAAHVVGDQVLGKTRSGDNEDEKKDTKEAEAGSPQKKAKTM